MTLHITTRTAAAVLVCCAALYGQLPVEARKAADTWLAKDCDVGEKHEIEAILEQYKLQLETVFIQALEKGPDEKQLATEQPNWVRQWQARQEALKNPKALGLSETEIEAARAVTSDQYLARQKADFILRYRSRAAAGLGIVDGEAGRAVLRAYAADDTSPLRSSAQAALRRLGEPPPKSPYQRKK